MRLRGERGVVSVETALVLPVVLTLVGGILLSGLRMWASATVDRAAQAGLRTVSLRETLGTYPNETPYAAGSSGYRDRAAALAEVGDRLPGDPVPATCTGTGAAASLPGGADVCAVVVYGAAPGSFKTQGDPVQVSVVRRVRPVEAAARLVPVLGPGLARELGTVRATASGRLE